MNETNTYFAAMGEMQEEMAARRYSTALEALKRGLRASPSAIAAMRSDIGLPPSIPFIESKGGVLAALFNDSEALELIEAVSSLANRQNPVQDYRDNAEAFAAYRKHLAVHGEETVSNLKSLGPASTASRTTNLLSWLEKNLELTLVGSGVQRKARWGGAEVKPFILNPAFRGGRLTTTPKWVEVVPNRSAEESPTLLDDSPELSSTQALPSSPLAPEKRQSRKMQTYLVQGNVWLVASPRRLADSSYETPYRVLDLEGQTVAHGNLPYGVVRVTAQPHRPTLLLLDRSRNVHIVESDGRELSGLSLAGTPEVDAAIARAEAKEHLAVRSVDIHPETGEVAVAVTSNFFRFSRDGKPITALAFVGGYVPELMATAGGIPEPGDDISPWTERRPDIWVYFVQFSCRDDSIFVSTYQGELLRYSHNGEQIERWDLSSPVLELREYEDVIIVSTFDRVVILAEGGRMQAFPKTGSLQLYDRFAFGFSKKEIILLDLQRREYRHFSVNGDIKSVYPVGGLLHIEQTSTYSTVPLHEMIQARTD